ncbi:MAG TPA: DUF6496 domain-containing protein [Gaiellaceae bacterium]|nr:DUF6496 domain-containing protein [Gaiellaceae bacterium]
MARKYSKKTSEKMERTMHEFKHGQLKSGSGGKVKSRKQAIAIGLSQARAKGYKVPPRSDHAAMQWKPGRSINDLVDAYLSNMRPGATIDARGLARAIGGVDPIATEYALEDAERKGLAVTDDGRWFGPAGAARAHARKKSPAQLDREIDEALRGAADGARHGHASIYEVEGSRYGVEIDPREFEDRDLPSGARWRDDLRPLAEEEMARGRSYRRPKDARYRVVEWTGYRAGVGKLIDWLEATPGITRYAELFS